MTSQTSNVVLHPYISYWGMHKSARVLDLLTTLYFPLYDLSHKDFFACYPVLGFVEALVYEIDEVVETLQEKELFAEIENSWNQKYKIIIDVLKAQNFYHPLIEQELENLGKYFALESQLLSQKTVTYADIIKATELRTSDVRALHGILVQVANKSYNQNCFDVMWPLEILIDIYDDLTSYKDDVVKNRYNTYRMFVKLYGNKARDYLKKELARYESLFVERLNHLPRKEQKMYMKLVSELEKDNSDKSIPAPIME
jgi:hypothetical protein